MNQKLIDQYRKWANTVRSLSMSLDSTANDLITYPGFTEKHAEDRLKDVIKELRTFVAQVKKQSKRGK